MKFSPPYQWTYYTYTYLLTLPQKIIEKGKIIYLFSLKNQVFTITITFVKRALTPENLEKNRIKGSRYKSARAPLGGLSFTSNIFVYFWNSLITKEKFTSWITKKVWLKKRKKKENSWKRLHIDLYLGNWESHQPAMGRPGNDEKS